jgi:hypothetical protein
MFLIKFEVCLCALQSRVLSIEGKDNADVKIRIWIKTNIWIWIKTNILRLRFMRFSLPIPYC